MSTGSGNSGSQGKVREINSGQGSQGKVREFGNFWEKSGKIEILANFKKLSDFCGLAGSGSNYWKSDELSSKPDPVKI